MHTHTTTTSEGRKITVVDDLFDFADRTLIMNRIYQSQFSFGASWDAQVSDFCATSTLGTPWDQQQWDDFGLERHPNWHKIRPLLAGVSQQRAWVNLHTGRDTYRYHVDHEAPGAISMLFYPNLKWLSDWDGQTIFKSADLSHIEYTSEYVPGRIVLFDSRIPHKAVHPNWEAVGFRAILNAVFY